MASARSARKKDGPTQLAFEAEMKHRYLSNIEAGKSNVCVDVWRSLQWHWTFLLMLMISKLQKYYIR